MSSCALSEVAVFSRESGSEDTTVVLELIGVCSKLGDVITEGLSIGCRTTREDTTNKSYR